MRALPIVLVGGLLLGGCASSRVTLLANEGSATAGKVGVFDAGAGREIGELDVANTQAALGGKTIKARPVSARAYQALFAGLPKPPVAKTLYFTTGSATELAPGSEGVMAELRALVNAGSDVQIIGHTDTVGKLEDNDTLSAQRAREVRAILVQAGVQVGTARITARGERDAKTADNVDEPKERRVEVIIR
jgi:outer membrane protein OmpA-like peptidoglycan-associated protein